MPFNDVLRQLATGQTNSLLEQDAIDRQAALAQYQADQNRAVEEAKLQGLRALGGTFSGAFAGQSQASDAATAVDNILQAKRDANPLLELQAREDLKRVQASQQALATNMPGTLEESLDSGRGLDWAKNAVGQGLYSFGPQLAAAVATRGLTAKMGGLTADLAPTAAGMALGYSGNRDEAIGSVLDNKAAWEAAQADPSRAQQMIGNTALTSTALDVAPGIAAGSMAKRLGRDALLRNAPVTSAITNSVVEGGTETLQGGVARGGANMLAGDSYEQALDKTKLDPEEFYAGMVGAAGPTAIGHAATSLANNSADFIENRMAEAEVAAQRGGDVLDNIGNEISGTDAYKTAKKVANFGKNVVMAAGNAASVYTPEAAVAVKNKLAEYGVNIPITAEDMTQLDHFVSQIANAPDKESMALAAKEYRAKYPQLTGKHKQDGLEYLAVHAASLSPKDQMDLQPSAERIGRLVFNAKILAMRAAEGASADPVRDREDAKFAADVLSGKRSLVGKDAPAVQQELNKRSLQALMDISGEKISQVSDDIVTGLNSLAGDVLRTGRDAVSGTLNTVAGASAQRNIEGMNEGAKLQIAKQLFPLLRPAAQTPQVMEALVRRVPELLAAYAKNTDRSSPVREFVESAAAPGMADKIHNVLGRTATTTAEIDEDKLGETTRRLLPELREDVKESSPDYKEVFHNDLRDEMNRRVEAFKNGEEHDGSDFTIKYFMPNRLGATDKAIEEAVGTGKGGTRTFVRDITRGTNPAKDFLKSREEGGKSLFEMKLKPSFVVGRPQQVVHEAAQKIHKHIYDVNYGETAEIRKKAREALKVVAAPMFDLDSLRDVVEYYYPTKAKFADHVPKTAAEAVTFAKQKEDDDSDGEYTSYDEADFQDNNAPIEGERKYTLVSSGGLAYAVAPASMIEGGTPDSKLQRNLDRGAEIVTGPEYAATFKFEDFRDKTAKRQRVPGSDDMGEINDFGSELRRLMRATRAAVDDILGQDTALAQLVTKELAARFPGIETLAERLNKRYNSNGLENNTEQVFEKEMADINQKDGWEVTSYNSVDPRAYGISAATTTKDIQEHLSDIRPSDLVRHAYSALYKIALTKSGVAKRELTSSDKVALERTINMLSELPNGELIISAMYIRSLGATVADGQPTTMKVKPFVDHTKKESLQALQVRYSALEDSLDKFMRGSPNYADELIFTVETPDPVKAQIKQHADDEQMAKYAQNNNNKKYRRGSIIKVTFKGGRQPMQLNTADMIRNTKLNYSEISKAPDKDSPEHKAVRLMEAVSRVMNRPDVTGVYIRPTYGEDYYFSKDKGADFIPDPDPKDDILLKKGVDNLGIPDDAWLMPPSNTQKAPLLAEVLYDADHRMSPKRRGELDKKNAEKKPTPRGPKLDEVYGDIINLVLEKVTASHDLPALAKETGIVSFYSNPDKLKDELRGEAIGEFEELNEKLNSKRLLIEMVDAHKKEFTNESVIEAARRLIPEYKAKMKADSGPAAKTIRNKANKDEKAAAAELKRADTEFKAADAELSELEDRINSAQTPKRADLRAQQTAEVRYQNAEQAYKNAEENVAKLGKAKNRRAADLMRNRSDYAAQLKLLEEIVANTKEGNAQAWEVAKGLKSALDDVSSTLRKSIGGTEQAMAQSKGAHEANTGFLPVHPSEPTHYADVEDAKNAQNSAQRGGGRLRNRYQRDEKIADIKSMREVSGVDDPSTLTYDQLKKVIATPGLSMRLRSKFRKLLSAADDRFTQSLGERTIAGVEYKASMANKKAYGRGAFMEGVPRALSNNINFRMGADDASAQTQKRRDTMANNAQYQLGWEHGNKKRDALINSIGKGREKSLTVSENAETKHNPHPVGYSLIDDTEGRFLHTTDRLFADPKDGTDYSGIRKVAQNAKSNYLNVMNTLNSTANVELEDTLKEKRDGIVADLKSALADGKYKNPSTGKLITVDDVFAPAKKWVRKNAELSWPDKLPKEKRKEWIKKVNAANKHNPLSEDAAEELAILQYHHDLNIRHTQILTDMRNGKVQEAVDNARTEATPADVFFYTALQPLVQAVRNHADDYDDTSATFSDEKLDYHDAETHFSQYMDMVKWMTAKQLEKQIARKNKYLKEKIVKPTTAERIMTEIQVSKMLLEQRLNTYPISEEALFGGLTLKEVEEKRDSKRAAAKAKKQELGEDKTGWTPEQVKSFNTIVLEGILLRSRAAEMQLSIDAHAALAKGDEMSAKEIQLVLHAAKVTHDLDMMQHVLKTQAPRFGLSPEGTTTFDQFKGDITLKLIRDSAVTTSIMKSKVRDAAEQLKADPKNAELQQLHADAEQALNKYKNDLHAKIEETVSRIRNEFTPGVRGEQSKKLAKRISDAALISEANSKVSANKFQANKKATAAPTAEVTQRNKIQTAQKQYDNAKKTRDEKRIKLNAHADKWSEKAKNDLNDEIAAKEAIMADAVEKLRALGVTPPDDTPPTPPTTPTPRGTPASRNAAGIKASGTTSTKNTAAAKRFEGYKGTGDNGVERGYVSEAPEFDPKDNPWDITPAQPRPRSARVLSKQETNARDIVAHLRGEDLAVVMNRFVHEIGGSGMYHPTTRIVEIALDAMNPDDSARHESTHDLIASLKKDPKTRRLIKTIEDYATAPARMHQMSEVLASRVRPKPDKEQHAKNVSTFYSYMSNDPQEAVAYLFQLYASDEGIRKMIDGKAEALGGVQGVVVDTFGKIIKMLRELVGVVTGDEQVSNVIKAFYAGKLRGVENLNDSFLRAAGNTLGNKVRDGLGPIYDMADRGFSPGLSRMRDMGIPVLTTLANRLRADVTADTQRPDFINERQYTQQRFMARMKKVIGSATEEEISKAMRELQGMKSRSSPLTKAIRAELKYIHDALSGVGAKMGYVENYFPRVWDYTAISENREKFVNLISKYAKVSTDEAGVMVDSAILNGAPSDTAENEYHVGFNIPAGASKHRAWNFIDENNAHEFVDFQSKDLGYTLENYIAGAAHRSAFATMFGDNGSYIDKALETAKEQGATTGELEEARRIIATSLGVYKPNEMTAGTRKTIAWGLTAMNMAMLPFAVVSQMIDPLAIASRSERLGDVGAAFMQAIKSLTRNFVNIKQNETEDLAEWLGVTQSELSAQMMMNLVGTPTGRLRKYNDAFFKWNGMQGFNNAMRVAAVGAGERYLENIAANLKKHPPGSDKANLEAIKLGELGLVPADLVFNKKGKLDFKGEKAGVHGIYLPRALSKFVETSVVRADNVHQPVWMSDPKFALLAHMRRFSYAFASIIGDRVQNQASKGNFAPLTYMLGSIPVIIAADIAKWAITGMGPMTANWGFRDWLIHGLNRAGILGRSSVYMSAVPGGSMFEHRVELGPFLEVIHSLMKGDLPDVAERTIPGARLVT